MKRRQGGLLVLALGLAGSQAGHLVAYQVRFGAAAQQLQSAGAHAYFPALARSAAGAVAALLLAALFVIGLARVLTRGRASLSYTYPLHRLVAVLFTVQLAVFTVQETLEAAASGLPATPVTTLLLWGALGQLPVAVVTAMALRWLLARLDGAVSDLRVAMRMAWQPGVTPAVAPAGKGVPVALVSRSFAFPRPLRGPPLFAR